ncbi:folate-binding protein [Paucibacter sp. PLA-PC-4]|uniref:CAF17-like 4Fe-4S cluster assembly/insertion protein YgfZ n=1 Tax=Paucibacter sp. PLA-PC-4 TaxID=2993655 RepID=UPI002248BAFE|nr:folate-binding protein [Paucibacter sp. PLA-PC-4]MCX2861599.1 folate-binding protein [Paucibacter sp. PLA-PC-4]
MSETTHTTTTVITGGALRLADWGVMRAKGEEAAKFLHGQLTQDIALQTPEQARLAGYCSAKGRLLATLLAVKNTSDELLLVLPAELLAPTLKRLSMFVLRARCKLSDASADWAMWGLAGPAASAWLGAAAPAEVWGVARVGEALVVKLPDALEAVARYALLQPTQAPAPALPALVEADWQWLEVQAGLAWVRGATVEQFVPQMINLELLGGVNFQKGCYPGQEVVARSQYRGTVKRRTLMFAAEGAAQAVVGQELFHSADPAQPAGLVAAVAQREGRTLLLAEVKLAALEGGSLHLGSAEGPVLFPRTLPYSVGEPQ